MYFPHAFRKSFLPVPQTGAISLVTSGTTANLTAGQIGMFNSKTFAALSGSGTTPFIIAQGSYFVNDKIGPVHGGYKESVKSKEINPKYISRVIRVTSDAPQNQIVTVTPTGCVIECNATYRLRLDIKGSPALRFLSHNLYRTLDAFTGCCDADNSAVDQNVVLLQWKDQINEFPLLKDFVQAKVWNLTLDSAPINPTSGSATIVVANADAAELQAGEKVVHSSLAPNSLVVSVGAADSGGTGFTNVVLNKVAVASTDGNAKIYSQIATGTYVPQTGAGVASVDSHIELATAYVDTTFGSCTFTVTDKYDLEPLFIYPSFTMDKGEPCDVNCFAVTELQAPKQASGVGETVLRDLILDGRYLQNAYPDSGRVESLRMREIEADPALATVNRSGLYDQVMILHSVPRFNNPTGTFDNDQYLVVVHVPAGTTTTALTNFVVNSAVAAGNAIALETY